MNRNITYASLKWLYRPATAVDLAYVEHVTRKPNCPVIAMARESKDHGNVHEALRDLVRKLKRIGVTPILEIALIEGSDIYDDDRRYAAVLLYAQKIGAIVITDEFTRHLRGWNYYWIDGKVVRVERPLTVKDCLRHKHVICNARIGTLLAPTATPSQVRSRQTKRGLRAKGNTPGRPLSSKSKHRIAIQMKREGKRFIEFVKRVRMKKESAHYYWKKAV